MILFHMSIYSQNDFQGTLLFCILPVFNIEWPLKIVASAATESTRHSLKTTIISLFIFVQLPQILINISLILLYILTGYI